MKQSLECNDSLVNIIINTTLVKKGFSNIGWNNNNNYNSSRVVPDHPTYKDYFENIKCDEIFKSTTCSLTYISD